MMYFLLPLLSMLGIACGAPFDGRLSLPAETQVVNASFLPAVSLNVSSLGHHDRCDSSKGQRWQAYAFLVEDCFVAINQFYVKHVVRNPHEVFEFSASPWRSHTRYPRVQTPDVFTYGEYSFLAGLQKIGPLNVRKRITSFFIPESCTLAIVMLNYFTLGQLPGNTHFNPKSYDTSTSAGLFKAAKLVENVCLDPPRRTPGWEPAGAEGNIGVFLWATDSYINREVTGVPGGLTNGSSAGVYDSTAR